MLVPTGYILQVTGANSIGTQWIISGDFLMDFDWICLVSGHLVPFKWVLVLSCICIPGAYLKGSD